MAQLRERLTTGRVAEMFGVDTSTIKRWASTGKIPAHVLPSGRFVYFRDEIEPLVPGYERADAGRVEAGRVDVELVLAVLAVVVALTLGLNFVGPHFQTAVIVLALSIGALCFYLGVLVTVPRAMPQPRRAGADRGRRHRTATR